MRVALCWQAEDQALFHRRIADAKASREEVEAHLRAVIYIDSLSVEEVATLRHKRTRLTWLPTCCTPAR
jgi:hypothetical protein